MDGTQNPIDKYFEKVTRYHVFFFFIFFSSKLPSVWHTLNLIFLSPPMKYTCGDTKTLRYRDNECPCDNPIWDFSVFTKTVQTKYLLICNNKWMISFSESMSYFGLLIGACVCGILSDRYGRLISYAACQFIIGTSGCLVAFMPNISLYILMRFFEGVGCGGAIVTGFVLCMENCGPKYRATVSSLLHIPSNLGVSCLAGISYLLRDCDEFQLAISVPVLAFVFSKCLLLESPKWLLLNNKEKAIKVMEKFCRFNKTPCATIRDDIEFYHTSRTDLSVMRKMRFRHIFRYREHTKNFFCMAYCYFVCGMCYYGVAQFIGKMSPSIHQNTVFNGLMVCSGTVVCIFIINRVGRRPYLRTTMFLAGIFMFIVVSLPISFNDSLIRVICACLSSSFYYTSFIILFLYGVELFPTSIRNSVIGMLSLASRIGQIMGPQINALSPNTAGSIFGTMAIVASLLTFFLPETKGIELPSTLEEGLNERTSRVQFSEPSSSDGKDEDKSRPKIDQTPEKS